ncbi:MAG: TIGR03936 family radical SAM-associated protein [Planctomycetota bacterium]
MLLVIKFGIKGSLRFLSHAETMAVFQRACIRAGINIQYSQGFNPRPRLSLPLPRPVGVESDDELLALRVVRDPNELPAESCQSRIGTDLFAQLPDGFELVSVSIAGAGTSFQPCSARYILPVGAECVNEELRMTIGRLLASENLYIRRQTPGKRSRSRNVDVRVFLESLELDGQDIIVECIINSDGSIRVDEILELLGLNQGNLAGPIRRTNVQWQSH